MSKELKKSENLETNQNTGDIHEKNIKRYIFSIKSSEEGLEVGFDSFNNQEEMSSADASMFMVGLLRIMVDSGLPLEEIDPFLKNISDVTKEIYQNLPDETSSHE